jgi:hypothetical protein
VDPTADNLAILAELAAIGLRVVRIAERKVQAADDLDHGPAMVLEIASRTLRRTVALRQRRFRDSQKTPEQRAAEQAQRLAALETARLGAKRETVKLGAEAVVRRESGPSDRENLLGDLRERLLYPDINLALRREDVSTVVMRVLKDLRIAPRNETWSDALMAYEISATHAAMQRIDAACAAGEAAAAEGVDWREGVEFTPAPGVETKRGRFTYGADGAVVAEEPPDVPQAAWPPGVVSGRDPPDTS